MKKRNEFATPSKTEPPTKEVMVTRCAQYRSSSGGWACSKCPHYKICAIVAKSPCEWNEKDEDKVLSINALNKMGLVKET